MAVQYHTRLILVGLLTAIGVAGCATESASRFEARFDPTKHRQVWVEPCVDRTEWKANSQEIEFQ